MLHMIAERPIPFLIALIIGLATAWWIWAQREDAHAYDEDDDAPPFEPDPQPEPQAEVEAEPAEGETSLAATATAMGAVGIGAAEYGSDADTPAEGNGPVIAPAVGETEDLTLINGIGPKLDDLLKQLGVRRFDQIAAWDDRDVAEVDAHLGSFKGRISRDQWVAQAGLIAQGKLQEWKGRFGYSGQKD